VAVLAIGPWAVADYFRVFPQSQEKDWVFAVELVDAINYLNTLPDDTYVYFFAERWSFDIETRQYLAPEYAGEDRSIEYGERLDVVSDQTDRPVVYFFFGRYTELVDDVVARYPQGTLVIGSHIKPQPFVAYLVKPPAATTTGP
jgi:hypothetical protein